MSTAERRNVPPVTAHECGALMVKAPSRGSRHCTNVTTGRTRASLAGCGPGGGLPPCAAAAPGSRLPSATRMTDALPRIPMPTVRASYTAVSRVQRLPRSPPPARSPFVPISQARLGHRLCRLVEPPPAPPRQVSLHGRDRSRGRQMQVGRLPSHAIQQATLVPLGGQRAQLDPRAIGREAPDEPLTVEAHLGILHAN